jgi:hypothetical protein
LDERKTKGKKIEKKTLSLLKNKNEKEKLKKHKNYFEF